MKLALVSDAWAPQTNGVVRTLRTTSEVAARMGVEIRVVEPSMFATLPCPTYPEIRIAISPARSLRRILEEFSPDAVHIATEGPLGHAARRTCIRMRRPFTTSYHTRFPEYLRARFPISPRLSYAYLRRFHCAARRTLVATPSMEKSLLERGFRNLVRWGRGVDVEQFRPFDTSVLSLPRPISVCCGRVAVEKNLEAFLRLDLPGSKVVVGDGPDRERLQARYPDVYFTGYLYGDELAHTLSSGDVFVFPSLTDTFGLVMLEAMACGLPVAAYPVTGPIDVVSHGVNGVLDADLRKATLGALELDRKTCRECALERTWERATEQFLSQLAATGPGVSVTRVSATRVSAARRRRPAAAPLEDRSAR